MAVRRVQLRRGTSAQNDAFTGAVGEVTVDTDRNSIRVHDGATGGGVETARVDLDNIDFDPNATVSFSDSAGNPTVRLTNVADPTGAQDVATKAYVDSGGASEILLEELGDTDLNDTNAYADAQMLLYDADTGKWWNRTLSGDATIDDLGVITLTANSVITTDITDGNVTNAKLANSTVTITDGATSDDLPLGQTLTFTNVANETTIAVTADAGGGLDGVEVTIGLPDDVTIGQDLTITRDLSVGRNAVITGNLTVNGTTTTINSTTVSTSDVVIELAQDADQAANASTDAGFVFTRGNTEDPAVLYFDEGDDSFYLGTGVGATGATTDFSTLNGGAGIDKGTLKLASLDATTSAIVTGDVTLKADNATFDIQTSAGASKFSVDSDNGNTLIAGTLGVTGISTFDDDLAVKANPTTSALVVNSDRTGNGDELDANVISVTRGALNSATLTWEEGADDFIFSEKLHSVKAFSVGGAGSANATASITALGAISTTSTLSVDGATTLNTDATITTDASLLIQKANAETDALILLNSDAGVAPQDAYISVQRNGSVASVKWDEDLATWALTNNFSVALDASVGQDLSVTRNAGVTGTLTVTSTTALNDDVTLNASDLTINDGLGNDTFTVDNATGNTVIEGTLDVTGVTTFPVNSVIADFTFTNGNIASATGSVSFNALPISTTGDISCVGLSNGDADITNVGDISLDSISADGNTIALNMTANQASAFAISEVGGDTYLTFNTTADNITFGKVFSAVTGSTVGTLTLANGSITDGSGAITFGGDNLSTTGTLSAGATTVTSLSVTEGNITNVGDIALDSISADATDIAINLTGASATALTISEVGGDAGTYLTFDTTNNNVEFGKVFVAVSGSTVGTLTLANGSITDTSGTISFGDEAVKTTGTLSVRNAGDTQNALIITANGDDALITSFGGDISFDNENLSTTGTLSAGASTLNSASVTTTLSVTGQSTLDDTLNIKTAPTNNVAILVNSDQADADVTIVKVNDTTANVQIDWDNTEDSLVVKGGKLHSETQVSVGGTITTAPNLTLATSGAITTLSTLSFETASTGAIVFNSDLGGGVAPANTDDFGITVNRGSSTDALLYWDESEVRWQFETGNVAIQNSLVVDSDAGLNGGAITISAGSITSDSGTISFGDETLNTTGSLTISTNLLVLDSTGGGDGLITANSGTISFDDENLVTTGEISTATFVASSTSTLSGNVSLHSGADLLVYSDAGVTQKLSIDGATGNVSTQGTLTVVGVSTHSAEIVPNVDGATSVGTNGTRWSHVYSDNVTITDDLTIDSGDLAVSTGTTTLAGLLNANGGIAVDGTKFTVADTTGNTIIEGTLEVNGATTLTSDVSVTNGDGGGQVFEVASASGNTTISGTLGVAKTTTINSADGSADLAIQNNTVQKFLVEGDTGNTDIEGTLNVAGNTEIETGSFTVTTGNAVITAGDLTVTAGAFEVTAGATTLQSVQATSLSQSGATLTLVSGGGAATDAFVSVERGATDAQIKWNETDDKWQVRDVSDGSFYDIVDTNTTLFSLNAGGNNKNFILSDGADTLTINGSGGVTVQHAGNGTVALSLSDSISVTSDLTVGGTATFNGATMRLVDTLLYLGLNNASTANNLGFYGQYKDGVGTSYYAGLVYQPLNSKFQLFGSETGLGSTEVSISPADTELGDLDLASLTATTALNVKSSSDDTSAKTAITLNSDQTGTPAATEDVSIVVERGDETNASLSWDEGDDRWTLDQGTGTSSIITTTTASEGARYACNEPVFAGNALSISAPSAVISKNAYFLDNGATAGTVTLFENASGSDGYVIVIFNEGTNTLTIQGTNGETVGGAANQGVASGASLTLMAKGTNWYVM